MAEERVKKLFEHRSVRLVKPSCRHQLNAWGGDPAI
jgi:hypothetical protein